MSLDWNRRPTFEPVPALGTQWLRSTRALGPRTTAAPAGTRITSRSSKALRLTDGGPYTPTSRIPRSGIREPGSGILDPGSGIRDPGSGIRYPGSRIRDAESGIRDPDRMLGVNDYDLTKAFGLRANAALAGKR